MKNILKKVVLVLSFAMIFTAMPVNALGTGVNADTSIEVTTAEQLVEIMTNINNGDGNGRSYYENLTINIKNTIDASAVTWVSGYWNGYIGAKTLTVNGNGNKIIGLNAPFLSGTWAGENRVYFNDLTIADSNIVGTGDNTAAFIGGIAASEEVVFNNCHLFNSTVNGTKYAGAFYGYGAGYSGNDGPVFTEIKIINCTVSKSEITGGGSTGGLTGHATGDAWTGLKIENTKVTETKVTSTDSSDKKAGAFIGTIGAAGTEKTTNGVSNTGGVEISECEANGNTVKSNGVEVKRTVGRIGSTGGAVKTEGGVYDYTSEEMKIPDANIGTVDFELNVEFKDGTAAKAQVGTTLYATLATAIAEANGAEIKLINNVVLTSEVEIPAGVSVVLNLNGKTISIDSANWPADAQTVFRVHGALEINGEGTVNSATTNNDYNIAVWARNGGKATINGGNFINAGAKQMDGSGNRNNNELIYASDTVDDSNNSEIVINGGTFTGENTAFVVNAHDASYTAGRAVITVNGGEFVGFNPADNAAEGANTNFVAAGLHACEANNVYTVHGTTAVAAVAPTCTQSGNIAYFTCPAGKMFSDAPATQEITDVTVPATGHAFGGWYTVKEPNCFTAGYEARVCSACGATESRPLAATTHNFDINGVCAICGLDKTTATVSAPSRANPDTGVHF